MKTVKLGPIVADFVSAKTETRDVTFNGATKKVTENTLTIVAGDEVAVLSLPRDYVMPAELPKKYSEINVWVCPQPTDYGKSVLVAVDFKLAE